METQTPNLKLKFRQEIDGIADGFVKHFGLKHEKKFDHLSDPLLRWLDFRLRYIDPKPRPILISNEFPKNLEAELEKALINLKDLIIKGQDINIYQGKGLTLYHDSSGEKRQNRTDLLWADWGITHLHLTTSTRLDGNFSERSGWLLFCFFTPNECAFLDVREHKEEDLFSNHELAEILIRNWPGYMDQFRLKGVLPPQETDKFSAKETGSLRKNGVTSYIVVDGKVYMGAGLGVTTASTPTIVTQRMMDVHRTTMILAEELEKPENYYALKVAERGVTDPVFSLVITPEGLAIYEASSDIAFPLPRQKPDQQATLFTQLHDLIAPAWVISSILDAVKKENPS